jgi:hypothetical protein
LPATALVEIPSLGFSVSFFGELGRNPKTTFAPEIVLSRNNGLGGL